MNKEVSKAILPLSDLVFLPWLCKPANTTRLANQNDIALVSRSQLFRRARIWRARKRGVLLVTNNFLISKGSKQKSELKEDWGKRKKTDGGLHKIVEHLRKTKKFREEGWRWHVIIEEVCEKGIKKKPVTNHFPKSR